MTLKQPDGLPVLGKGSHVDPHHGACVLEYVSLLAGEPWGDRPRCVDPGLAALARLVNDALPRGAHHRLAALAPQLIGTTGHRDALMPQLVLLAVHAVRTTGQDLRGSRRAERTARRRLDAAPGTSPATATWLRLSAPVYRNGPALHTIERAVSRLAHGPQPADTLLTLLADAAGTARASLGQGSSQPVERAAIRASRAATQAGRQRPHRYRDGGLGTRHRVRGGQGR